MFCKYCGNQISDDSLFCEKCGKLLKDKEEDRTVVHDKVNAYPACSEKSTPINSHTVDEEEILAQAKFEQGTWALLPYLGDLVGLVIGIVFISWANSLSFYDRLYVFRDVLRIAGIIMIILVPIRFILTTLKISFNKNSYCTVYENRVVGTGAESVLSRNLSRFELSYKQINSVSSEKRYVTISADGRKFIVAAASPYEAQQVAKIIGDKLSECHKDSEADKNPADWKWKCSDCGEINSMVVTRCTVCGSPKSTGVILHNKERKLSEGEWLCPTCGRVNQNYVGTCGCGTIKPR